MSWISKIFKRKPKPEWVDPLDPHGDGTIREGDPMFELMMDSMNSGKAFITEVDKHGNIISNRELD